jgi:hypothetical protein
VRCGRAAERALALALLLAATLGVAAEPAPGEDFMVVQPGDTCQTIGQRLWGAPDGYKQLHALNNMKNGHPKLEPGTRLRIRPEPEAHLTYVKPDVNTRPPEVPQWKPGQQGEALYRLYQVNTLRGAGAEVTLKDTSKLRLRENALVVIYGAPQATPKEQPRKSGGVELVQGDLRMSLAALRGEPLPLETPAAKVAANGKDLFVSVDAQRMSRVAVFDGRAQVAAKGAQVEVPGGQGTRVEEGKAPEPPRPLLPGPAWSVAGPREVLLVLAGAPQPHTLKWQPVQGAVSYRAVLARDESFNDVVAEAAPAEAAPLTLEAGTLPPGRYYARVQAMDTLGLPGMPSPARAVHVVAVKVERGEVQNPGRVTGRGQVKLSVEQAAGIALRVKGKAVGSEAVLLAPGVHTVDAAGALRPVSVEVKPSVTADVQLRPEGARFKLEVDARPTEAGAPPIADGALLVSGLEGSAVSNLVRKGETRWEADVTPARAGKLLRAAVEVRAYGEPVGRANAEAEPR